MGLFSSGPDEEVQELIDNARGDSVTSDKLTKPETGRMAWDRLNDGPLMDYLEEDEQPHYILTQQDKSGIAVEGSDNIRPDGKYRTMMAVTDRRIIFAAGGDGGDRIESIEYDSVTGIESRTGTEKSDGSKQIKLTIETPEKTYRYGIDTSGSVNLANVNSEESEVNDAIDYISSMSDTGVEESQQEKASIRSAKRYISEDESAEYVTPERVAKVKDILDGGETVYYLTRGSTVDVEGSSAGESLWGDDRSRKSGTKGYVRAAITDKRVAVKIPQLTGNDERSVPYQSITSVDLDTGLVNKRLSLQTPGQTYHIEAHDPGKDEVRQAVKFIRDKITESNEETVVVEDSSEPDPTEQLKNLKELHDEGVLSDEEFEEKKSDLLDKI
jgi:hypothetical protein